MVDGSAAVEHSGFCLRTFIPRDRGPYGTEHEVVRYIPNILEYKTVLYHTVLLRLKTVFFFFDSSADKYIAL